MGVDRSIICSSFVILMIFSYQAVTVKGQSLIPGYYSEACPLVESIVQATMNASFLLRPSIAPAIRKLFYSDCFVQGCDASVLISGPNTEKTAEANLNLRGFEVIEVIKSQIELLCPGVVSCADILALSAREAVVLTKGPYWEVKLGRKDGNVSLAVNVKSLPSQINSITEMLRILANYGLNTEDFVALIGGPTFGTASCKSITDRISSINGSFTGLNFNPQFLARLQQSCPIGGDGSRRVALDKLVFDTSIFKNIIDASSADGIDQIRSEIRKTYLVVQQFLTENHIKELFTNIFMDIMKTLSEIKVKTGLNGEIETVLGLIN